MSSSLPVMMSSSIVLFTVALVPIALSQFVPAPTELTTKQGYAGISVRYKEVPTGICELDPNVRSYAGYADVAPDQHIFWWFFEARNQDPSTAPLTTWINGGPGSSSMIGLFQELGPCGIDGNGNVVNNPYSWSNVSNMLFIDQPTQVGFSYSIPIPGFVSDSGDIVELPDATCPDYAIDSDSCGTYSYPNETLTANSTLAAAPNFWKTIQGFMGAFPQYSRNGFHFTTESYGGHYGPVFNEYIEEQNAKNISSTHQVRLESVLIGNGWYDPLLQYQAYYNFTVYPGNTYDYAPYNASLEAMVYNSLYGPGNCVDQIKDCAARGINEICSAADDFCASEIEFPLDRYANRDEYDIRELSPDPFPYEFYVDYLNSPQVQQAIGAFQNFSESNNAVGTAFGTTGDDGREVSTVEDMRKLLEQGVTVVMYTGDADYNCNWFGGEAVADELNAPGFASAGYTDIETSDGVAHGQVKQAGAYSFVRIYESGHEVPFYQPLASLEMFERAINGMDIATGKTKITAGGNFTTKGTPRSLYREGNATVQFDVLPNNATYNTTLNGPNPAQKSLRRRGSDKRWRMRR